MKTTIHLLLFVLLVGTARVEAQTTTAKVKSLRMIKLNAAISTHFISPEPIQTVDISTKQVAGDLPVSNVLRVKPMVNSLEGPLTNDCGVITIIGQTYMAQYQFEYVIADSAHTQVSILPEDMTALENADFQLSTSDMYAFSLSVLKQKPSFHNVRAAAYGMHATLNNIYSVGNYFFLDISFRNKSHIQYDIDQLRFKIEDKRITKATNVQSIEVLPVYQLYPDKTFRRQYRNVFVFKKFTFPGNKIFSIELAENQISGRVIYLQLEYSDVLHADTL